MRMGSKGADLCRLCACKVEDGRGRAIFGATAATAAATAASAATAAAPVGGGALAAGPTHHTHTLSPHIRRYLRLEVRENDDLPQSVCPRCCTVLEAFHKFAEDCLRAQDKLVARQVSLRMKAIQQEGDAGDSGDDAEHHSDAMPEDDDFCVQNSLELEWGDSAAESTFLSGSSKEVGETSASAASESKEVVGTRRRSRKQSKPVRTVLAEEEEMEGSPPTLNTGGTTRRRAAKRAWSTLKSTRGTKRRVKKPPPTYESDVDDDDGGETAGDDEEADPDYNGGRGGSSGREAKMSAGGSGGSPPGEKDSFRVACMACGEEHGQWRLLARHCRQMHASLLPQAKCTCGDTLTCKRQMERHRLKHLNAAKYSCDQCSKSYCYKSHLEAHRGAHLPRSQRPFQCSQCPKRFHAEALLKHHEKTHVPVETRAIWQCDVCNKKMCTKNSLLTHQRIVHMGERSYVCDICGRTFTQKGNLKDHLVTHSDDTPFKCDKCGKGFKTKSGLKIHVEIHNEDPLVCTVCGMHLATSRTLKRHMVTHSDDRPYRCMYCGKGFKRSKDLKGHYEYHEGKKTYHCQYCGRNFNNSSNCRSHQRRMHVEELRKEGRPPTTKKVKGMPSVEESSQPPPPPHDKDESGDNAGHSSGEFQTPLPTLPQTALPTGMECGMKDEGGSGGKGVMQVMSDHAIRHQSASALEVCASAPAQKTCGPLNAFHGVIAARAILEQPFHHEYMHF